ncbi:LOW QUALITY PROTEIN: uncharacterized protein O8D03_017179 [Erethizon dorsatum]
MTTHRHENLSTAPLREFVLEGFRGGAETQALLFAVFLALYMASIMGNLTMITVITLDARLHSPMYFFLKNLSFLDFCYSSVFAPKALTNFFSSSKVISLRGCAAQLFFFSLLGTTEALLLAVMAYDRFMAICNPLYYPVTMCHMVCTLLVLGSYCGGCLNAIVETSLTFKLPFCGSDRIDHFFCDVLPLLRLTCADTALNELVMFSICGFILLGAAIGILTSYGYITVTILRMPSGSGRHKVFSTCGSHLTAVCLFYGTGFVVYGQPGAVESMEQGKVVSIFYTQVTPMLNPLIYSLRNKDVKDALRRLGQRRAALELIWTGNKAAVVSRAMTTQRHGSFSAVPLREFVLVGFRGGVETQALLFALFLALYMVTMMGNLTMVVVITLDARLHSPMYFFLKNLSFLDLCYSSVIAPNALANFFSSSKVITFAGCATQFFFLSVFANTETFLLAVMAYDRFMAICSTLRSNHINHFFCDVRPLLQLACADTALNELVVFGLCGLIIVSTTLAVLISYGYITVTILRMHSGSRRHKFFSTCGSHLTAASLFYGTLFVMYAQPGAVESMEQGKVVSIFYTQVIPMLKPLIYSLWNEDVKDALRRLGQRWAAPAVTTHRHRNLSAVPWQEFVLVGFRGEVATQALLFTVFLALYTVTIMGNLTMIMVITLDARLHSPMYFFLKNLSFLDLCYSSVIAPNALANFFSSSRVITFIGCATQLCFFSLSATTEAFLLAVMAYDRFMAICSPLRYHMTMSPTTCACLVLGSYCGGCLNSIVHLTFQLPFCSSNRIDHFFCDVHPLLQLACADTALNELLLFGICGFIIVSTVLVILVSYGYITVTILRMRSGSGRVRVFSTCGSHMTAVSLFYGTVFVMYAQPGAVESMEQGKVVSIFYTQVIPMLNPLIYSLRNKDVKDALRRLGQRRAAL